MTRGLLLAWLSLAGVACEKSLQDEDSKQAESTKAIPRGQELTKTHTKIEGFDRQSGWYEVAGAEIDENKQLVVTPLGASSATSKDAKQVIVTNLNKVSSADHLVTSLATGDGVVSFDYLASPTTHAEAYIMGRYALKLTPSHAVNKLPLGSIGPNFDKWGSYGRKGESWGQYPPLDSFTDDVYRASEWNRVAIRYRAPRYDEGFNKAELPVILEVRLNDTIVQRNVQPEAVAPMAMDHNEGPSGPFSVFSQSGPVALANISFAPADFSAVALDPTTKKSNEAELVDLVQEGNKLFHNNGCGECHAVKASYAAVKSGPSLYGLFQKTPKEHKIVSGEHEYTIKADSAYLKKSIRAPEYQLALYNEGSKAGQAYMPIMPRYTKQLLSDKDILAIEAYLLTRNPVELSGPVVSLQTSEGPEVYDPLIDPFQFLVLDQVRIQRGPMSNVSARAVHVGTPNAVNYSFDPRTLAVERVWQGGFLETSGEFTNRGGQGFQPGYEAVELNLASSEVGDANLLVAPLDKNQAAVDLSAASPIFQKKEGMDILLNSASSLEAILDKADAAFKGYRRDSRNKLAPPTFLFRIHNNALEVTHRFHADKKNHEVMVYEVSGNLSSPQSFAINNRFMEAATVDNGKLDGNIWTLPAGQVRSAQLKIRLPLATSAWRPDKEFLAKVGNTKHDGANFTFRKQALQTEVSNADLPAGYQVKSWRSPRDQAGREQLFEALGLDQSADGTIVLSTRSAGIWKVQDNHWIPFAEGLNDSLGVLIEEADNGPFTSVVAGQKPELTRITDVNNDGIADEYLTLYDQFSYVGNYHTFMHGPERDAQGNYWFTLNLAHADDGIIFKNGALVMGTYGGYLGWAIRVLEDAQGNTRGEPFAYGLRSPASLGKAPNGELWYADNQGDMVGTSKFFLLKENTFYGHTAGLVDLPGRTQASADITWDAMKDKKVKAQVLIPQNFVANSPGNPEWDESKGRFGVSAGQMIFGDQTQSSLHRITLDTVNGQTQGAVIPWMSGFESGIMRPLFLNDGSLLLGQTGRGWNAKGGQVAALQRVTYDAAKAAAGRPQIKSVTAQPRGFKLILDRPLASLDSKALEVTSWVYVDSPGYGSDELGRHLATLSDVALADGGSAITFTLDKTAFDSVDTYETGRVYEIKFKVDDETVRRAYYTAHSFPSS